jgi:hypothetical protein
MPSMDATQPRVEFAETTAEGVVIAFDNGRCVPYPTALLRRLIADAIEIEDPKAEEDSDPEEE